MPGEEQPIALSTSELQQQQHFYLFFTSRAPRRRDTIEFQVALLADEILSNGKPAATAMTAHGDSRFKSKTAAFAEFGSELE